jgi:hypothetical protein
MLACKPQLHILLHTYYYAHTHIRTYYYTLYCSSEYFFYAKLTGHLSAHTHTLKGADMLATNNVKPQNRAK